MISEYSYDVVMMDKEYIGLAQKFRVNPKSCGNNNHFEMYLPYVALHEREEGLANTTLLIGTDIKTQEKTIIGYITLRANSYIKKVAGNTLGYPALEITQLAVDERFEKQGFGSHLVDYAMYQASSLNYNVLGVQYIVLCSDPKSVGFYAEKKGFGRLDEYSEVPREEWSVNCIPMFLKLNHDDYKEKVEQLRDII